MSFGYRSLKEPKLILSRYLKSRAGTPCNPSPLTVQIRDLNVCTNIAFLWPVYLGFLLKEGKVTQHHGIYHSLPCDIDPNIMGSDWYSSTLVNSCGFDV